MLGLLDKFVFLLQYTNTLTMAQNLNTPMFQDNSSVGKGISLVVRVLWVWFGGMLTVLLVVPFSLRTVLFLILPPATITLLAISVINLLV